MNLYFQKEDYLLKNTNIYCNLLLALHFNGENFHICIQVLCSINSPKKMCKYLSECVISIISPVFIYKNKLKNDKTKGKNTAFYSNN